MLALLAAVCFFIDAFADLHNASRWLYAGLGLWALHFALPVVIPVRFARASGTGA